MSMIQIICMERRMVAYWTDFIPNP